MKQNASFHCLLPVLPNATNRSAQVTNATLMAVLESLDDAIMVADRNYNIVLLNQMAKQLLGRAYQTGIKEGDNVISCHPVPLRQNLQVLLNRVLEGESLDHSLLVPNTTIWLHHYYSPLPDADGDTAGICIRFKEIPAEKKAEYVRHMQKDMALVVSHDVLLFEQFMNYSPLPGWITDEHTIMRYMNAAFMKALGFTADDLGKSIYDLFPEHLAAEYHANNKEVIARAKDIEIIERSALPDGSEHITKVYKFPIHLDGTTMVAGWSVDITQTLTLQSQLIESLERYSLVQQATSDAIYDWQIESKKIFRGKGFVSLFGLDEQPVSIRQMFQSIHPEDRDWVKDAYFDALRDPQADKWSLEYRFRCADDTYKYVADKGSIKRYAGRVFRVIGALQDITEHKQLQKKLIQQEKSSKKKLVRSIIEAQEKERRNLSVELHDNVNQMLASCKLMLEVACDGGANAPMLTQKSSNSISQVINEIRKISHDLNPSALQDVGLYEAVGEMVESINAAGKLQVFFSGDCGEKLKNLNEEDSIAVYRIIQEQMNNILKHSKATTAFINIVQDKKQLHLTIKDDGIGMDVNKVKKGLGLRSIQNRVDYYQGKLRMASEEGKGTAMKVLLNLAEL